MPAIPKKQRDMKCGSMLIHVYARCEIIFPHDNNMTFFQKDLFFSDSSNNGEFREEELSDHAG